MAEEDTAVVDLGFAEESDELWLLTNKHFPSKIGGKPAWLDLDKLPSQADLKCAVCSNPCILLCQVYAPIENNPECFHRTIYLFVCPNGDCCQSNSANNIIALRCQLERSNQFYSYDPPDEEDNSGGIPVNVRLCDVCGCRGTSVCSKCKKAHYCGPHHQRIDWKNGHKQACSDSSSTSQPTDTPRVLLFPEFELVIERESFKDKKCESTDEDDEKRRLEEFNAFTENSQLSSLNELPESELLPFTTKEDKTFSRFKKRIQDNAEQVLRYNRNGTPLWISEEQTLNADSVPNCSLCGCKRIFEFQIMPQLLNHIKDEHLDWGIIAVYTCEKSCNSTEKYTKEYVFKQDIAKE